MENKKNSVSAEALSDEAVENITGGASGYGKIYTVTGSVVGKICPECHNDCWTYERTYIAGVFSISTYQTYHCAACDCLGKYTYYSHNCGRVSRIDFPQTTISFKV